MPQFDLFDQATLTDLVSRPLTTQFEDQPRLGDLIAPLKDVPTFEVKLRVRETLAFGKGQFRAPDATPALFKAAPTFREEIMQLVLLDEMERLSERDYINLNSPDETVRQAAGVSIVERGQILALRNERLTEWMRWKAFLGNLTVEYPSGQQVYIDYGIPAANKVTASPLWSTVASADPIANIKAWADQIASLTGYYGLRLHMSSDTWDLLVQNAAIRALLTNTDRSILVPTRNDILSLLRDGTEIVLYDNGYRDVSAGVNRGLPGSLTRFLPYGKVLMTTEYNVDGMNIADTLNGPVTISTGYNTTSILQGPQSEVVLDHISKNYFYRVASARVPRLNFPECFVVATVA